MTSVLTCGLLVYSLILHVTEGQIHWNDCVADDFTDVIKVYNIAISPLPIRLPGQYNVTFNATVNKYIDKLFIDVEVGRKNESSGKMEKIYPKREQAAIRVYNGCKLIDKLLFSSPEAIERDIDVQIDKLFVDAIRYHAGCPLLVGTIILQDHSINLPMDLIAYNALRKGNYDVKITFKSNKRSSIGCAQFPVEYGGQIMNK